MCVVPPVCYWTVKAAVDRKKQDKHNILILLEDNNLIKLLINTQLGRKQTIKHEEDILLMQEDRFLIQHREEYNNLIIR